MTTIPETCPLPPSQLTFDDITYTLDIEEMLGEGGNGRVYRARKLSGPDCEFNFAIKQSWGRDIANEIKIMQILANSMYHNWFVGYRGFLVDVPAVGGFNQTFILMDLIHGEELFDVIGHGGPSKLTKKRTVQLFTQLVNAIKCMHSLGIAHW